MSAKRNNIRIGDVISIPIDEKRHTYGQFIEGDKLLGCYVVYNVVSEHYPTLDVIVNSDRLLMFFTQGHYIVGGQWKVIGNTKIPPDIKVPVFKVELYENNTTRWMVMDYNGAILRPASENEISSLSLMHSYTSALVDDAIKAKYDLLKWESIYNGLLYRNNER